MYVVIGANGYIGSYVIKNVLAKTQEKVLALGRTIGNAAEQDRVITVKFDLANINDHDKIRMLLEDETDLKAIYLAAFHHPDEVKKNYRQAWDINVSCLSRFVNCMPKFKCLFYISTEMVYGEGDLLTRFREKDNLYPVNEYGKQKIVAENIVLGYGYHVVRFPFVIGPSLIKQKPHFYDIIVNTLRTGKKMEMFADSYKSALDFNTAAETLIDLMLCFNKNTPNIINVSGDEALSKYEIGKRIAIANGLNPEQVVAIKMSGDSSYFVETRANCALMDNSLVKEILNIDELKLKF